MLENYSERHAWHLGRCIEYTIAAVKIGPSKTRFHRIDGPAREEFRKNKLVKQEYWVYGWRVYLGTYLMMIRKAKDKNKKFCEIIEKIQNPGERYRVGVLLCHVAQGLDEKLIKSTLAALSLIHK
jgi:hypothetical protein